MKKFFKILIYYALIPFIASLPGFILNLCGLEFIYLNMLVVPLLTTIIYVLFRNKLDMKLAVKTNGIILFVLLICFTIMMIIAKGNTEGRFISYFSYFILPFLPILFLMALMGQFMILYICAFLTYFVSFIVSIIITKTDIKKYVVYIVVSLVCIGVSTYLYCNRPSVKYAGHGFDYMHGYSSTDFTDYMVYSEESKLVILNHEPSLIIDKQEDMPVLDGAEALYPMYAAFAKNVYKDIDKIETKWLQETEKPYTNGKIVTFTNTVEGFARLIYKDEFNGEGVDMFFGAYPSQEQLDEAKELGIELEITPIGKEAFVFFVEKHNPVDNLSSEQIKAIYHGDITNWKEVGGNNEKILAFQRPKNSGSQTMMEYFMDDISLKEPQTYETIRAMAGVIKKVAQYNNEDGALGYTFRYFLEELNQEEDVKILNVDGIYPSLESIEDGSYPLTSNICLITRKNDPNPYVQKMIDFILSDDGQEIIHKTGYSGLNLN